MKKPPNMSKATPQVKANLRPSQGRQNKPLGFAGGKVNVEGVAQTGLAQSVRGTPAGCRVNGTMDLNVGPIGPKNLFGPSKTVAMGGGPMSGQQGMHGEAAKGNPPPKGDVLKGW